MYNINLERFIYLITLTEMGDWKACISDIPFAGYGKTPERAIRQLFWRIRDLVETVNKLEEATGYESKILIMLLDSQVLTKTSQKTHLL